MADYIDRTQALGYPLSFDHYDKQNGNKHFINGVESYGEYIEGLPSVDAVEVVRCKNCKHRWVHTSISKKTEIVIECTFWDKLTEFDGFCNNAEEGEGYE